MKDRFGFSSFPEAAEFGRGSISPVAEHEEACEAMESRRAGDGFVYPDLAYAAGDKQTPWLLHRLPTSHEMELREVDTLDALRNGIGAFVMHFFGLLTGCRCQFEGWWVDGRIPTRNENGFELHVGWQVERSLDAAIARWEALSDRGKTVATNALFLHNRAPGYLWDWQRFQAEYQVFDTLYSVAKAADGLSRTGHGERFRQVAEQYGLQFDADLVGRIVRLRNDLVHDSVWPGGTPTGGSDDFGFRAPSMLHRFNARLALVLFGVEADVTRSSWWTTGQRAFGMAYDKRIERSG